MSAINDSNSAGEAINNPGPVNAHSGFVLLTTFQVLELLGISRATLYRLEKEGILKPVEFPGNKLRKHRRVRFSSLAVEKVMREAAYDYDFDFGLLVGGSNS